MRPSTPTVLGCCWSSKWTYLTLWTSSCTGLLPRAFSCAPAWDGTQCRTEACSWSVDNRPRWTTKQLEWSLKPTERKSIALKPTHINPYRLVVARVQTAILQKHPAMDLAFIAVLRSARLLRSTPISLPRTGEAAWVSQLWEAVSQVLVKQKLGWRECLKHPNHSSSDMMVTLGDWVDPVHVYWKWIYTSGLTCLTTWGWSPCSTLRYLPAH